MEPTTDMIKLNDLEYSIGERTLIHKVNASINVRDRIGLVGPNGSGKTTMLRIMKGDVMPSNGYVERRRGLKFGYLPQEDMVLHGSRLKDEVLREYNDCLRQLGIARENISADPHSRESMKACERAEEKFHKMGGYGYENKAYRVLAGLGFAQEEYDKKVEEFSSGWQMRIVLARILLNRPDVLMLDEPTNHLDIESIQWLEEYLQAFGGAIIAVSHDRYFLDKLLQSPNGVCGIWELDDGVFRAYRANYTDYLLQSDLRKEKLVQRAKVQEKRVREIEEFIARNKANKSKAKLVRSREKYLGRLERIRVERERRRLRVEFPVAEVHSRRLVELKNITKRYGERTIFRNVNFTIEKGDKIALIGKNGAGKSTLSRIICGLEDPSGGECRVSDRLQVGVFSHDLVRALDPKSMVVDEVLKDSLPEVRQKIRTYLGLFLFSGDDINKKVGVLSGGEKTRLVILKSMLTSSNLLVLDEPTYHLDKESTDSIQHAVQLYEGAVVLVTHDRDLINAFARRIIEMKRGQILDYPGDFSYYLRKKRNDGMPHEMKRVPKKKPSKLDMIKSQIAAKEERQEKLRATFMRGVPDSSSKKSRRLFEEYQRLTQEIQDLQEQLNGEVSDVHRK
ncbi:MAG: ATP-binding cassette domain-containing protein [candidate division WOR-3 bacterium]|nr:ATP-binding cassette domain-containing protein [candidate division WOR-3 bacterium]